jgi:hypothetical protein
VNAARTSPGYLLVESRTWATSERFLGDALALARAGERVSVLLVGDAVAAAVRGASAPVTALLGAGAEVWVDDFSLAQRAFPEGLLADGVAVVDADRIAECLIAPGVRLVWH